MIPFLLAFVGSTQHGRTCSIFCIFLDIPKNAKKFDFLQIFWCKCKKQIQFWFSKVCELGLPGYRNTLADMEYEKIALLLFAFFCVKFLIFG